MNFDNLPIFKEFLRDTCYIDSSKLSEERLQDLYRHCSYEINEYIRNDGVYERNDLMDEISFFLIGIRWPLIINTKRFRNYFNESIRKYRLDNCVF